MFYLNILLSSIITTYFNNSLCLLHIYDNISEPVQLKRIPVISRYYDSYYAFLNDQEKCEDFLLQTTNNAEVMEKIEDYLNVYQGKNNVSYTYCKRKYIIIITDEQYFKEFFEFRYLRRVRNILVIYASNESNDLNQNPAKFPKLLDDHVPDEKNNVIYHLFTHKYIGVEGNNDSVWLDTWHASNLSFQSNKNLYPDKVSDQQGRELIAICYNLLPYAVCNSSPPVGNEHNIVVKYAKRFNFTLSVTISKTNDFAMDALSIFLDDDDWDVIYGGIPERTFDGIRTAVYTYVVLVPLPNIKYGFFTLVEIFDWKVWAPIILLYIATCATINIRGKMTGGPNATQPLYISYLELYGVFIYQAILLPTVTRNRTFYNYIIMVMSLACILLTTAFNSRLSSVMVSPVYENNINTLSQLDASDLKFFFLQAGGNYFLRDDPRRVYKKLHAKADATDVDIDAEEVKKWLLSRDYAVALFRRDSGVYNENAEYLELMHGKYKPITPALLSAYIYLTLMASSMHTEEMTKLVMAAEETGLVRFWEDDALRILNRQQFYARMQEYSFPSSDILNINHLKGIFAFWGCGLIASTIIFFVECHMKDKQRITVI